MKHDNDDARPESIPTIADDEIVTKRKVGRRSFLSSTGAVFLTAGSIAIPAAAQQDDPDKRPDDKPRPDDNARPDDKQKPEDREKADARRKRERERQREKEEQRQRSQDPDKPSDPHN